MRRSAFPLALVLALLAGCVTINVYFPAAEAQQAADKIIDGIISPAKPGSKPVPPAPKAQPGSSSDSATRAQPLAMLVLDAFIPAAHAAQAQPDFTIRTPEIDAVRARMRDRFQSGLGALLDSGAVGYTYRGDIAIRDPSKIPLAQRSQANRMVAADNADRATLYKQLAIANGHPEWEMRMREEFAKRWIAMARPGWYYQDASGNWQKK